MTILSILQTHLIVSTGTLFTYGPCDRLTGFLSGHSDLHTSDVLVFFVAGLTDGPLSKPYLPELSKHFTSLSSHSESSLNVSLIQLTLGSSYLGFGASSLCSDVYEMDMAIETVLAKRLKPSSSCARVSSELPLLFILGHSTGCQDAIHYCKNGYYRALIKGIILQGTLAVCLDEVDVIVLYTYTILDYYDYHDHIISSCQLIFRLSVNAVYGDTTYEHQRLIPSQS